MIEIHVLIASLAVKNQKNLLTNVVPINLMKKKLLHLKTNKQTIKRKTGPVEMKDAGGEIKLALGKTSVSTLFDSVGWCEKKK